MDFVIRMLVMKGRRDRGIRRLSLGSVLGQIHHKYTALQIHAYQENTLKG